jgi:hypothetical protein
VKHVLSTGLLVAVSLAAPALAGDLARDHLPAGTRWIAHVDVEGLAKTELFAAVMERDLDAEVELDELGQELDLDPMKDFLSVTFFGTSESPEDAIALVMMPEASAAKLFRELEADDNHVYVEAEGIRLHAWTDGDVVEAYAYERPLGTSRLLILSDERARLLHAIRVVEGDEPSVADADHALVSARPNPGSFFYLEAKGGVPHFDGPEPMTAVGELVQGLVCDVSEKDGKLAFELEIATDSSEDAQDVFKIAQGGLALAQLLARQSSSGSVCADLIGALALSRDGGLMHASFRYRSRALVDALCQLDEL